MSLSALCLAEADVLMGQDWRVLLPRVSITRWPLFLGIACQIHPWKNELSKHSGDLQAPLSIVQEGKTVCLYLDRKSYGKSSIKVQLLPQTSRTSVKW